MLLTAMMDLCKDNTRISTMQEEVSLDFDLYYSFNIKNITLKISKNLKIFKII